MSELSLLLKLFWQPTGLLLVAATLGHYGSKPATDFVAAALAPVANLASSLFAGAAALFVLWRTWQLIRASRGIGELCHSCGMPVRLIHRGRYSPHYRCLVCGTNRRID